MARSNRQAADDGAGEADRDHKTRGGIWITVAASGTALLSLLTFSILSRILEPEVFGVVAMVNTALAVGEAILRSGLADALIQREQADSEHSDTLFWTLQLFGLVFVGALIASQGLVEALFQRDDLGPLLAAGSFVLYLVATGAVPRALLAKRFGFVEIGSAELAGEAAGGLAGVGLALAGGGAWSLVGQQLAARGVSTVLLWRRSGWTPRFRWSSAKLRDVAAFSLSQGGVGFLRFLDAQVPRVLLGRYLGATVLGNFFFARRMMEMAERLLLSSVRALAMPSFARIQSEREAVRRTYIGGVRTSSALLYPAFLGALATAPLWVPLVFGEKWIAAVPLIQIFAIRGLLRTLATWDSALLRGLGKPELLLLRISFRFLTSLALIYLFWPWGAAGIALASVGSTAAAWWLGAGFVRQLSGIGPLDQIRAGGGALTASILMAVAVLGLRQLATDEVFWLMLGGLVAGSAAAYAVLLRALAPEQLAELLRWSRTIRRVALSGMHSR